MTRIDVFFVSIRALLFLTVRFVDQAAPVVDVVISIRALLFLTVRWSELRERMRSVYISIRALLFLTVRSLKCKWLIL